MWARAVDGIVRDSFEIARTLSTPHYSGWEGISRQGATSRRDPPTPDLLLVATMRIFRRLSDTDARVILRVGLPPVTVRQYRTRGFLSWATKRVNSLMPSADEQICVVIGRTRHKMVQIEIQEAAKRGARMIELRLDFLAKAPDFKRLLAHKPGALVATVRRPQDGGRWSGSEDERRMLLRQAIVGGFDWVDVETDIADDIRRFKDVKRIVSYHNLREVPADLERIHERMCQQDADVVKLAVTAQHPVDNLRVLKLLAKPAMPTVAFCMGDLGIPSRILGAKFGAPFTYAAFNKERGIAPGILSYEELKRIYHYGRINTETKIFGVIGDPVAHSLSPLIQNAAFQALGINGIYVPFRVPRASLEDVLKQFERLPVQGYSVTIPHKEAAASLAQEKDAAVELTHAANTLVRE